MLCSKCKIICIHVPNYDSYICEYGHVLCRTCSAQSQNRCGICNGQIIRHTELHLEGVPIIRFRKIDDFPSNEENSKNDIAANDSKKMDLLELIPDMLRKIDDVDSRGDDKFNEKFDSNSIVIESKDFAMNNSLPFTNSTQSSENGETFEDYGSLVPLDTDADLQSELSDSNTVIQHLTEFRNSTKYVPPSNLAAFKIHSKGTLSEPAIITTSRINIARWMCPPKNNSSTREMVNSATIIDSDLHVNAETKVSHTEVQNNNKPRFENSIREKFKEHVYSQFDKAKSEDKNVFMIKGDVTSIPSKVLFYDATSSAVDKTLAASIGFEVERTLKNLNLIRNIPFHGSQRRKEIVKRSKCVLRQKILEEIYSPFGKENLPNVFLKEETNIETIRAYDPKDLPFVEQIESVVKSNQLQDGSVIEIPSETRTVGLSTESYPKLNPDISAITSKNDYSDSYEDVYIQEISFFTSNDLPSRENNPRWIQASPTNSQTPVEIDNEEVIAVDTLRQSESKFSNSVYSISSKNELDCNIPTTKYAKWVPEVCPANNEPVCKDQLRENIIYCYQTLNAQEEGKPAKVIQNNAGDLGNFEQQPMGDYSEGTQGDMGSLKEISHFIEFMQKHYPHLSLKDLKELIMKSSLPNSENTESVAAEPEEKKKTLLLNEKRHCTDIQNQPKEYAVEKSVKGKPSKSFRAYFPGTISQFVVTSQYQPLHYFKTDSLIEKAHRSPVPRASDLKIPRTPVICPISSCTKLAFVSEFGRHIKVDHGRIPIERIASGVSKNFFLDSRIDHCGINRCRIMYMVCDKIRELGSKEYKDYLPILVMSTKVNYVDLIHSDSYSRKKEIKSKESALMIWLTGLSLPELPIFYTLVAWSRNGNVPRCHVVQSGQIYSIRNKQDFRSIFKSGQFMLLQQKQWLALSNQGQNLIEIQVVVH